MKKYRTDERTDCSVFVTRVCHTPDFTVLLEILHIFLADFNAPKFRHFPDFSASEISENQPKSSTVVTNV